MKFKQLSMLVLISLLCTLGFAQSQGEWIWQNPKPQGNRLTNIHVFGDGEIFAVGYHGTTLRSFNNGIDWDIKYSTLGPDVHQINRMQFVDENNGWALETEERTVYFTTNRGASWEIRTTNTIYYPTHFFALDDQRAWMTGVNHLISLTTDGGVTWTEYSIAPPAEFTAGGIFFLNQNEGWVVGANGTIGNNDYAKICHTMDGGLTWTELFTSPVENTAVGQVFFLDENIGWAGGTDATIMGTTDGGQTWSLQFHRPNTNYAILDLHFFDSSNGIAVGTDGLIVTTTNGGQTWEERNSTTEVWIRDISPANNSTIWGCGESGLLIRSDDGGINWSSVSQDVTTAYLACIEFSDEMTGWAGGPGDGLLFKTEDGGENWFVADSGEHPIYIIQFLDPLNGYRIEWYGQTYRTRDGGNTWEFTDILGRDGLCLNGFFADTSTGWLSRNYLGDGYIRKTTDGAQSWQTVFNTPEIWLWEIKFINNNIGWVCGGHNYTIQNQQGFIYKTTDGGLTWQEQVSNYSEPLYEIDFIDENIGWCVGAWGTMLKTTDGGENWNEVNTPFTDSFTEAILLDENTGWIIGNGGVGRTFDGGQSWETFTPPHGLYWIYGGAYFTSANNGWLVGSNGHILKFEGGTNSVSDDDKEIIPKDFVLFQNYPNPFNPTTKISWKSAVGSWQTLKIYDVLGNVVATLVDEFKPAGNYEIEFDASRLSSGIYFYQLQTDEYIQSRKMLLLK